jgi:hypothetical protein
MAGALSSTYDTTYLQVPMASYIATVDSFPQQTRGAANALPHYPRTLKNAFSFFLGSKWIIGRTQNRYIAMAVPEDTFGTDGMSFSLLLRKSSSPSKNRCSNDPFFKEFVTKYMTRL